MSVLQGPHHPPAELPLPPLEMRELVGPTSPELFDNPTGAPVFGDLVEPALYDAVFDFGCGCGRLARQLVQQRPQPTKYLGTDLHPGLVRWCQQNLTPRAPQFRFEDHAIFHPGFRPDSTLPRIAPLPADDAAFSLCIAWSVFTHTTQAQTEHYLREAARLLRPEGMLLSTWFLFDKRLFPMMQDFQQTLYINEEDPTNATIHDADWVMQLSNDVGLTLVGATPPAIRGFAWILRFSPTRAGVQGIPLPPDDAPLGRQPPPLAPPRQETIGLEDDAT